MFDIFQQPWTLLIIAILGWFVLLLLHGDSRLWWQSHLVIFLAVAIFTLDILVGAGLFKFSKTLTLAIQAALGLGGTDAVGVVTEQAGIDHAGVPAARGAKRGSSWAGVTPEGYPHGRGASDPGWAYFAG